MYLHSVTDVGEAPHGHIALSKNLRTYLRLDIT